jgi:hypothetical protein
MVKQGEIAKALGISEAAVSKSVRKGMPTSSIDDAKAWRDSRPRRRLGAGEAIPCTQKPPIEKISSPPLPAFDLQTPSTRDDESGDTCFNKLAISQAERVLVSAFQFYEQSLASGNVGLISAAIKNWGEAGKVAATLRERYTELQEKSRQLVDLDVVIAGVGIEVGEWRRLFDTLGTRLAGGRISAEAAKEVQLEIDRVKRDLMPRAEMVARTMFAAPEETE